MATRREKHTSSSPDLKTRRLWEWKGPPERQRGAKREPGFPQSRKVKEDRLNVENVDDDRLWVPRNVDKNLVYLRTMNRLYFVNCVQRQMFMCRQYLCLLSHSKKTFSKTLKRGFYTYLHPIATICLLFAFWLFKEKFEQRPSTHC